jgi:hypothetical protein
MTFAEADALATALDINVEDIEICHACLSFIALSIEPACEREAEGCTRTAPDLWAEGLALAVRLALERAQQRGISDAEKGIAAVREQGPRSPVARAVARRLGWACRLGP